MGSKHSSRCAFSAAAVLSLCIACSSTTSSIKGPISPSVSETSPDSAAPKTIPAKVVRIVDGDTARMDVHGGSTNERVRFIGIDTPERGKPYFSEASQFAESLLQSREVYLELDLDERDRYGRLLAYVWLSSPQSTSETEIRASMFNAKALLDGYAALLTVPPNVRYVDYFIRFQKEAREGHRGLWR